MRKRLGRFGASLTKHFDNIGFPPTSGPIQRCITIPIRRVDVGLNKKETHGLFARRGGGAEQRIVFKRPSLDVDVGSCRHEKSQAIRVAHARRNTGRRLQDPPFERANGVGISASFQKQSDDLGVAG